MLLHSRSSLVLYMLLHTPSQINNKRLVFLVKFESKWSLNRCISRFNWRNIIARFKINWAVMEWLTKTINTQQSYSKWLMCVAYRTEESSCCIRRMPEWRAVPECPLLASIPASNPAFISSWRAPTRSRKLIFWVGWLRKLRASRSDDACVTPRDRRQSAVASNVANLFQTRTSKHS